MGISPLDPASDAGRPDREIAKGHGSKALGPSDSSDTGSDLIGAPGDRLGPGQRSAAGDEAMNAEARDIEPDHIDEVADAADAADDADDAEGTDEEDEGD